MQAVVIKIKYCINSTYSKRIQSKAQLVTPAAKAVGFSNTPMVTPKFDPRLVVHENCCVRGGTYKKVSYY